MSLSPSHKEKLRSKDWRVSHLYKIKNRSEQLVTFKPNRAQKHFNENKHNNNIILKSRRLGFTTYESVDSIDDVLWSPNYNVIMLSYDKESALEIFDEKILVAWENYPEWLKNEFQVDSNRSNKLKFDFGVKGTSSIIARTKGRSGTYNRAHVSEFGKICKEDPRKAKEIVRGTLQAIPLGGRKDIESTAEGEEGLFHDMFWDAWERETEPNIAEYKAHFYNWTWDDEEIAKVTEPIPFSQMDQGDKFKAYAKAHDLTGQQITFYYLKWLELLKDWNSLRQEYPTTPEEAFISSGNKLFDVDILERYPIVKPEVIGKWQIFEDYIPGNQYGIGVDVSEGIGADSSAICVWNFTSFRPRVVAHYIDDKIKPDNLAYEVRAAGIRYGTAIVAVERNNHGHTTLSKLKEIYPLDAIYKEVKTNEEDDKETVKLGWHTNLATKPRMMLDLRTATHFELIKINSRVLKREMRTYTEDKLNVVKSDPESTNHWDLLMAAAIGFQMKSKVLETMAESQTVTYSSRNQGSQPDPRSL